METAMIPVIFMQEREPAGFGKQEFSIKLMNNNDRICYSAIRIRKATKMMRNGIMPKAGVDQKSAKILR